MKTYVLDTGAISQYFAGHQRMTQIFSEIENESSKGLVPEPILSEFYYKVCQKLGNEVARIRFTALRNSRLNLKKLEDSLLLEAGRLKCQFSFVSLADSFVVGLALLERCTLVTTDKRLSEIPRLSVERIKY